MGHGRGPGDAGLATGEAARLVGVSRYTLLRAVRRGNIIPARRTPGGYYRFDHATVAAYADQLSSNQGAASAPLDAARAPSPRRRAPRAAEQDATPIAWEWWHALYAVLPCGVIVLDAAGKLVEANEAARRILGINFTEMRGHLLAHTLATATREDGSDLPAENRPSQAALRTGRPWRDVVMGITRHDGERRWLQVDAAPVLGDDGVPVRVVTSFIDITARRQAERALWEREASFHVLFAGNPLPMWVYDRQTLAFVEVNDAAVAHYGYTRDEFLALRITDIRPADDALRLRDDVLRERPILSRTGGWRHRLKDGTLIDVEITSHTLEFAGHDAALVVALDITERKRMEETLRHQALHDTLTGLPNRGLLYDRLRQALLATRRTGQSLALLLLDLDHFKDVNDTLGHHAGDLLLRQVADRLRAALRATDTVARLGGDEFAVLLPGADRDGAVRTAGTILAALTEPFALPGNPKRDGRYFGVGVSIGLSFAPDHGMEDTVLLRHADMAMYAAKRAGGGYAVYASDPAGFDPLRPEPATTPRGASPHQ